MLHEQQTMLQHPRYQYTCLHCNLRNIISVLYGGEMCFRHTVMHCTLGIKEYSIHAKTVQICTSNIKSWAVGLKWLLVPSTIKTGWENEGIRTGGKGNWVFAQSIVNVMLHNRYIYTIFVNVMLHNGYIYTIFVLVGLCFMAHWHISRYMYNTASNQMQHFSFIPW